MEVIFSAYLPGLFLASKDHNIPLLLNKTKPIKGQNTPSLYKSLQFRRTTRWQSPRQTRVRAARRVGLRQPDAPPSCCCSRVSLCPTTSNHTSKSTAASHLCQCPDVSQLQQQGIALARSELYLQVKADFCERPLKDGQASSVGISVFYFFLLFLKCK